jgi:phosphoglycolate phosphatase-like HAD superfamily hydrolase
MPIRQVVLDFDGTCTVVEEIAAAFMRRYRELVREEWSPDAAGAAWDDAEQLLRAASPVAGWTLGGAPSAPAAADPFILSGEVVALLARRGVAPPPRPDLAATWYRRAYDAHPAPFRRDARAVVEELVARGVRVAVISNSPPDAVAARVDGLGLAPEVRARVRVQGNAAKFRVAEPRVEAALPAALAARFAALPAATPAALARPVYVRRAAYFEALCGVWQGGGAAPEETLVAGDVWELDLALPAALGCAVHLVLRAPPHETYPYELAAIGALGAAGSVGDGLGAVTRRAR